MTGYLWIKAFHIIAVICWFAGIFYLPRLFVYHSMATDQESKETFKVMERKLMRAIMNPSMLVTLVLGIWLLVESWQAFSSTIWIWAKVCLVVLMVGYHHYCQRLIKQFAADQVTKSHKFFRVFNELPVLVLIAIVILVVLKPF
ncbi:MAG: protoporphyrinogen oxidase HemJ [Pseudomonadota bacterium]